MREAWIDRLYEQGREAAASEIALRMMKMDWPVDVILFSTEITKEQLESIATRNNIDICKLGGAPDAPRMFEHDEEA